MAENKNSGGTNRKRKKIALVVFGVVLLLGAIAGFFYVWYTKTHISTDDAFVHGTVHTVAPKIPGTVLVIKVSDNEFVHTGDLLVELEPDIYEQKVREETANLKSEESKALEIEAQIEVQKKKITSAEANLARALAAKDELAAAVKARGAEAEAKRSMLNQSQLDLRRAENLIKEEVISRSRYDNAKTAFDTALSDLNAAEEMRRQAEVSLRAHESTIAQAGAAVKAESAVLNQLHASLKAQKDQAGRREAQLELAKLNLSYTNIISPGDGYVTRKSAEIGNQVAVGQPLMAIVPLSDTYVVANYKETEVKRIKPGQRVKIQVDAYPGKEFWGKVDSIMAGTGAVFSLFPPENATGNYVKVVQRIPVKIVLEKSADPDHVLRVGMSIVPTVYAQ
jgi:membrane fusion protein (multidrug efflux system)